MNQQTAYLSMQQAAIEGKCSSRWIRDRLLHFGIRVFKIGRKQFVLREEFSRLWKRSK